MYALQFNGRVENAAETIEIGKKPFLSTDNVTRQCAIQTLSFTYNAIGDHENAKKYASMAPVLEDYLVHVLKGNELVKHCKQNMWNVCDMIDRQIAYLLYCKEADYTPAEKHEIREKLNAFYGIVFSDGDPGFYEDRLGKISMRWPSCLWRAATVQRHWQSRKKWQSTFKITTASYPSTTHPCW